MSGLQRFDFDPDLHSWLFCERQWAQQLLTLRQPCRSVGTFQVWGSKRFKRCTSERESTLGVQQWGAGTAWCLQRNIQTVHLGTPFAAGLFDTLFEAESSFAFKTFQRNFEIGSMNSSRLGFQGPLQRSCGCWHSCYERHYVDIAMGNYFKSLHQNITTSTACSAFRHYKLNIYEWLHLEICLIVRERVDNSAEKILVGN